MTTSRSSSLNKRFRRHNGFTLIEMIVTIVVIGIIGVGIASFIGRTTEGMIDASERNKISAIAWIVSEKLSRELRTALPNSVREVNGGSCIEFVPTIAATDYLSVPVSAAATSFELVPFPTYESGDVNTTQDRISVYPNASADVYDLTANPHVISSLVASLAAGATAGSEAITLSSAHQFISDSPTKRLYVVQDPVTFCFDSGFLYRYSEYGFDSSLGLQNQTVIADAVSAGSGSFTYSGATLTRNGVVNVSYSIIGNNGELQAVDQEVQVRNVP